MKEVNGLFNEMDDRKVHADHVTCNTLINSYSNRGTWPDRKSVV